MTRRAYNRIGIYGHCGWVSSAIVRAFAASGAPVKVLYHTDSNIAWLPSTISTVEVDVEDHKALVFALQDIDVVISLVGPDDVKKQYAFIRAISETEVKLFSPSHLGVWHDEQGLSITINHAKHAVERAAREAGIPTTVILAGLCAEFALNSLAMGVDIAENTLVITGESARHRLNLCTRAYIGAAYASIFATTPISRLRNRHIGLSELLPTGDDIAKVLTIRHGTPPKIVRHSIEKVDTEIKACAKAGNPMALLWYCRKLWGVGRHLDMIGKDIWDVDDFQKVSLYELVVEKRLSAYRDTPTEIVGLLRTTFL